MKEAADVAEDFAVVTVVGWLVLVFVVAVVVVDGEVAALPKEDTNLNIETDLAVVVVVVVVVLVVVVAVVDIDEVVVEDKLADVASIDQADLVDLVN